MPSFRVLLLATLVAPLAAQSVPDRVLVGYWHNWSWPSAIRLAAVPSAYDVVNVAFATPTTPGGATMQFVPDAGLYASAPQFAAEVQALQATGRKVVLSIGGGNDPVHVDSVADEQAFATSMAQIVATYGFDGVDIDLEGSSLLLVSGDRDFRNPTSPRIVHFIAGVQRFLATQPTDFLLTAAPETAFVQGGQSAYAGVWGAYLPVLHALRHRLNWVQVQHYNTGSMLGRDGRSYQPATADFHAAMADALIGGFQVVGGGTFAPLRPDQVVIGLPATTQAAGSGYTPPSVVHEALDHLFLGDVGTSTYRLADPNGYPRFRGLMTWSIHWDVSGGGAFAAAHRPYLDTVFLRADRATISAAAGGAVQLALRAGRENGGRFYALVASASGTFPGTPLPGGAVLPINLDFLSQISLDPAAGAYFANFVGNLDSAGDAAARMTLPPLPAAVGVAVHCAALLPWDFVTGAVRVELVP